MIKKTKDTAEIEQMEVDFYGGLEIKSGMRASFIADEFMLLENKEEKLAFMTNLIKNKVINTEVMKQIVQTVKDASPTSTVSPGAVTSTLGM